MIDTRDVQMLVAGAAALRLVQWFTAPNRPRTPHDEFLARQMWVARFGRVIRKWAALRERVTGRKYAPGVEVDMAREWARKLPRVLL